MEAKELVQKMIEVNDPLYKYPMCFDTAKGCAIISIDNKYNGIIYVLGELKSRGELSDKVYLKCLSDLNIEREYFKSELEKL